MGKNKGKNKDEIPNPTSVTNRDILQRLNFLYQASVLLNGLAPPGSDTNDTDTGSEHQEARPQRKKKRRVVRFEELARSYVETMKSIGRKTNVKLDPSVKRRICKRCCAPLIPGISATVRVRDSASHGHLISYQCHGCQTERRIPAPPTLRVDASASEDTMEATSAEASTLSMSAAVTSAGNSPRRGRKKRTKRGPRPRLPPHFACDVGHVVFRGNERLDTAHSVS